MKPRIVLAYSGGVTATAAVAWLGETQGADIVAVTLDLGQGDNLVEVRDRALAAGAVRCHVFDAREAFARDHVVPSLRAQALAEGVYPMATALGRPLIASRVLDVARFEQAERVAHGGEGDDGRRITCAIRALDPDRSVIAVADIWGLSVPDLADHADRHGVPGAAAVLGATRRDRNLWGRASSRRIDDAWQEPGEDMFTLTRAVESTPDDPAFVEIAFDRGAPVQINGVPMPMVEFIESLTTIAGEHGIGRLERVTRRAGGGDYREVHEAPAAVVLHKAHADLASFVAAGRPSHITESVARAYSDLIDAGEWHSPLRRALDGFVDRADEHVSGSVRLKLFKGVCRVVGRSSRGAPPAAQETPD